MGSDGCGEIVDVGEGVDRSLIGKTASYFGNTWSEYIIKDLRFAMLFSHSFHLERAACAFVNPVTAIALNEYALESKSRSFI